MTIVTMKVQQTGTINFTVTDVANQPIDLTTYTVTLVIRGPNVLKKITGTKNSPNSLGTGYFSIVKADYVELRPNTYDFEVWISTGDGANDANIPVKSGRLKIVDVPQRLT